MLAVFLFIGVMGLSQRLAAAEPSPAALPMQGSAEEALAHLRQLKYQGDADAVLEFLAPISREFVLRRSRSATRENIERIEQGVHGFAAIASRQDDDAAVLVLRVVNADARRQLILMPFYLIRLDGTWHYLPNPTRTSTWYQTIPQELQGAYTRLAIWVEGILAEEEKALDDLDPASLLASWQSEMAVPAPEGEGQKD
ncbi:MAG: hypothetical protein EA402_07185 [Planctomycetota bacterium]|nr:MAG: hypothetical protein EA402_07185 [Planctomycetota bacterium]